MAREVVRVCGRATIRVVRESGRYVGRKWVRALGEDVGEKWRRYREGGVKQNGQLQLVQLPIYIIGMPIRPAPVAGPRAWRVPPYESSKESSLGTYGRRVQSDRGW